MTISAPETNQRFRAVVSIESLRKIPATTIGIEPMMTYHPILASGVARTLRFVKLANQAEMIRAKSFLK